MSQKGGCIGYFDSVWSGWGDHFAGLIEEAENGLYPIENKGYYRIDVLSRDGTDFMFVTVYGRKQVKFFEWEYPVKTEFKPMGALSATGGNS
jgi:hypothetical protein